MILIGWMLFALIFTTQGYVQMAHAGRARGFVDMFVPWLLCSTVWAMLTPILLRLSSRLPVVGDRWLWGVLWHLPIAVATVLFHLMVYVAVRHVVLGPRPAGFVSQFEAMVIEQFHAGMIIYFAIIGIGVVRELGLRNGGSRIRVERPIPPGVDAVADENTTAPALRPDMNGGRLTVKDNGHTYFVAPKEIDFVTSEGNYVKLHTRERRYMVRATMNAMEGELGTSDFVRIRRSTIVRISRIAEIEPGQNGGVKVILLDGTVLDASRRYRKNLEKLINSR